MGFQRFVGFMNVVFRKPTPMFERYTENARRTIFFGRWEAIQRDSVFIESDHILLALLRDAWLTSTLLNDISVVELRDEFPAPTLKREESRTEPDAPLTDEAKRVLRNAAQEADVFFDHHIGNEHLLLGLLREKSCSAARMLTRRGLGLESLRSRIKDIPRETRRANSGEQSARWRSAGIPEGYACPRLFYNAACETVVVELQGTGDESHHQDGCSRGTGARKSTNRLGIRLRTFRTSRL
jgi:ATP-dependent Clp protease ATP-binding subunit ClpA